MLKTPIASNDSAPQPAVAAAPSRSAGSGRVAVALVAVTAGLGLITVLLVALANPALVTALAPLVILGGAGALWAIAHADHRRLAADLDRLAGENANLARRVAARRETEQALLDARRRAEAANTAKTGFLAAVSHEFRTPLNGILGLTGLLLESDLTPDQETYARGVHSSGEALLRLVDDLLDITRIEAGRLDLRPEPIDVEALLREVGELLAGRAHMKAIDLAIDPDSTLPARVLADAQRLRQVLINLVGNAIKFTEAGGVTLTATSEGDGGTEALIVFTVEDSGPGIEPAEADRIFGEFEQVDTALNRRHGGAGLGLAISRRIVRAMGGDIDVRPRPGGGSIFSFSLALPVVEDAPKAGGRVLASRSIMILAPAGAEANALARELKRAGATARVVNDLVSAAALVGAASAASLFYDAVLIDNRLPPEPAVALKRLRDAAGERMPAVFLIEPGERNLIEPFRGAGFDAYLVRPVRRNSLLKILSEIVDADTGFHADPVDLRPRGPRLVHGAATRLDILLAEDNEINALLVRAVLEGLGHNVTEVRDGAAAAEAATSGEGAYAAILMDLHMPGLDGIAAARAIRAHERSTGGPRAAILALTADVLAETRAAAKAAGIDAILEKPIAPEKLREVLAEVTRQPLEPPAG